jgi:hypothetical protein
LKNKKHCFCKFQCGGKVFMSYVSKPQQGNIYQKERWKKHSPLPLCDDFNFNGSRCIFKHNDVKRIFRLKLYYSSTKDRNIVKTHLVMTKIMILVCCRHPRSTNEKGRSKPLSHLPKKDMGESRPALPHAGAIELARPPGGRTMNLFFLRLAQNRSGDFFSVPVWS